MLLTPEHHEIHKKLDSVAPGSPEERQLLEETRSLNSKIEEDTQEHKAKELVNMAGPEGVVSHDLANKASEIAVQHTTEVHQIPVHVQPHNESHPAGEIKAI